MSLEKRLEELTAENTRRRIAAKTYREERDAARAELEKRDKLIAERDKQIAELNEKAELREVEFDEQLSQFEKDPLTQRVMELENELLKVNLGNALTKKLGGELADGVDFDAIARNIGLDMASVDPSKIDDGFIDELAGTARAKAPYLFRPAATAPAQEQATDSRSSRDPAAAMRRLPTLAGAGSGGGAPTPMDNPNSAAERRDPAVAIRQAMEKREQRLANAKD